MELITSWTIVRNGKERTIELLRGDLAKLPAEHAVDFLVLSAFPDDYTPAVTSLIGALERAGLSVAMLAENKKVDLREQYGCWLSHPLPRGFPYGQLLCVESGWTGTPPEITDDLFRALTPLLLTDTPNASVAMPILGTGDQGWPADQMTESLVRAAVGWIRRGLPLRVLKIIAYSEEDARRAKERFTAVRLQEAGAVAFRAGGPGTRGGQPGPEEYDVFLSYSHQDASPARLILESLKKLQPTLRIFHDRTSLRPGQSWLMQVAESLDVSRRVVTLYTQHYWKSPNCKDEFGAAMARQNDTGQPVLFPIYYRTANIPYMFRNLQYVDCLEGDRAKLTDACLQLSGALT